MRDSDPDQGKTCAYARDDEPSGVIRARCRRARILLASGDETSRSLFASAMREMGLDVEEVTDGGRMLVRVAARYRVAAGADAEVGDIDLIVCDVRLPVCNGLEIFKAVRAAHWTTPVILVTHRPTREVLDCAGALGAALFIEPMPLAVFERTVRDLLDGREPLRARAG